MTRPTELVRKNFRLMRKSPSRIRRGMFAGYDKFAGGKKDYRAPEGKSVTVPYRGPVGDTLDEIMGGLRSACTYVGTESLKDFSKCCKFVRVNRTHNKVFE